MMRQPPKKKIRCKNLLLIVAVGLLLVAVLLHFFQEDLFRQPIQPTESPLLKPPLSGSASDVSGSKEILKTTAPQLEIRSDLELSMGQKERMLDGVHAFDDQDGDLTQSVTWHGNINFFKARDYQVIYRVTNSAGHVVTESRRVHVTDPFASVHREEDIQHSDDPGIYHLLHLSLKTLEDKVSQFGVFYLDLESDEFFSINADRQYRSASTAKVFTVMALYEEIAAGRLDLEDEIHFTPDDYEEGSGILKHLNLERPYTLQTLADYAIMHSDNIAFHMIMRTVGRDRVYDYYEGVIGHPTDRGVTHMSAQDAKRLLRHLHESDNPYFDRLIHAMRHTIYEDALPGHLPEHVAANKIGFFRDYFHDMAIVLDGQSPYILAAFSEGIEAEHETDPAEIIAWLSRMIYENR